MGIAGQPVQVRNHDGEGVDTKAGPFLRSDVPIAGFAVIEASTLEEAVSLVSKTPCAVAHGVVEVWPLESTQYEPSFVRADAPLSPYRCRVDASVSGEAPNTTPSRRRAVVEAQAHETLACARAKQA